MFELNLQNVPPKENSEQCSQVDGDQDKKRSGSNVEQSPNNQPFNLEFNLNLNLNPNNETFNLNLNLKPNSQPFNFKLNSNLF